MPGTGRSTTRDGQTSGSNGGRRSRVVTYVLGKSPVENAGPLVAEEKSEKEALTQAAHAFVVTTEEEAGWQCSESQDHRHQYQLRAVKADQERHIIIKAVHGAWDEEGIELSPYEHEYAQTAGDRVWLYVVEHALGPLQVLHCIPDPIGKITQYRLDHGWKLLGGRSESSSSPTEGMRIETATGDVGTIENVIYDFAPLLQLEVRFAGDILRSLQYDPLEHRLLPAEES